MSCRCVPRVVRLLVLCQDMLGCSELSHQGVQGHDGSRAAQHLLRCRLVSGHSQVHTHHDISGAPHKRRRPWGGTEASEFSVLALRRVGGACKPGQGWSSEQRLTSKRRKCISGNLLGGLAGGNDLQLAWLLMPLSLGSRSQQESLKCPNSLEQQQEVELESHLYIHLGKHQFLSSPGPRSFSLNSLTWSEGPTHKHREGRTVSQETMTDE